MVVKPVTFRSKTDLKLSIILLILIILFFSFPGNQVVADDIGVNKLDSSTVNNINNQVQTVGKQEARSVLQICQDFGLGLTYKGEIIFSKNYGSSSISRSQRWASVSKSVFALIVMQLVEDGVIDIKTPIRNYAAKYANYLPDSHKDLNLESLLVHLGGVCHLCSSCPACFNGQGECGNVFLNNPREYFRYSSCGFGIIGDVLRTKTGQETSALIENYIAKPIDANSLQGTNNFWTPAAYVQSDIYDMARFGTAVVNHEYVSSDTLYGTMLVDYTSSYNDATTGDKANPRGIGFSLSGSGQEQIIYHSGYMGDDGERALLWIKPRKKLVIAMLCQPKTGNTQTPYFWSLAETLETILYSNSNPTPTPTSIPSSTPVPTPSLTCFNNDNQILNTDDVSAWADHYLSSNSFDINADFLVNTWEFGWLLLNWHQTCSL
ncbi:MAG TPA: serine hydrolase [Candidatus Bathyarchaeia archaeon]|nr:serine hydrolase [Candidatus Bathyarchaeia archaeon]